MDRRNRKPILPRRLPETERPATWIVYAATMFLLGGVGGYVLAGASQSSRVPVAVVAAAGAPPAPAPGVVDEKALRAYRDVLARDPKNFEAAVVVGNMLYDAKRFGEAVPFYRKALAINPTDVNVSTDLGTALWYSGRADEALGQYARSLAVDPTHALTLFNMGIVKSEGKSDYAGAVAAWEVLLEKNPGYEGAIEVRGLIANARRKLASRPS